MSSWLLPVPSMGTGVLVALLVGVACALYAYATRNFGYWRCRGVPFLRPLPIAGNLKEVVLFRKHIGDVLRDFYTQMKGQPYMGMFFFDQPVLFIKDIALLQDIKHKDFEHFQDRSFSPNKNTLWSETLFAREGKHWKDLRLKLTPAFTIGKLKRFYVLLQQKAANLDHYFDDAAKEGVPCDVTHACARYTMDAIATVGFGIETTCLTDDDDPLHRLLRSVFIYSKIYSLASLATFVDMPLLRALRVSLVPAPLVAYLRSAVWGAAHERQRLGTVGGRKDLLDLLLELRHQGHIAGDGAGAASSDDDDNHDDDDDDDGLGGVGNGVRGLNKAVNGARNGVNGSSNGTAFADKRSTEMDDDGLVAQAFSTFAAGFDTTSSTMSFALYHLAKDEAIQDRLRTLLQNAVQENDGKLTYEAMQNVEYLDMIFSETLRLYPSLPFFDRKCSKAYKVPGTDIVIDKGVVVFGSLLGIQKDPQYFADPESFDPDRFSAANKKNILKGSYAPFGDGPRKCIGMRLAYLQGKLGLAHLILNYKFRACAETPSKMEYNLHSFLLSPRSGVPLKISRV